MKRFLKGPAALALALLGAGLLTAAGPPAGKKAEARKAAAAAPSSDALEGVFLASDRPVLLRLHLRIGNQPYHTVWSAYMKKLFAWLDRNGDGFLDKKEVEGRVPSGFFLSTHLQGTFGYRQPMTASLAQLDTNKDGKVSLAEFMTYYRNNGFGPMQFSLSSNASTAKAVTSTLFKYLDTNKDGKLSKEELAAGPRRLRKLDQDEDETFTNEELNEGSSQGSYGYAPPVARGDSTSAQAGLNFLEVRPETPRATLARQILARYDKNKDGKLDKKEIALDPKLFALLDTNKDGKLDAAELARFFDRDPDLVFVGRVGKATGVGGVLSRIGIGAKRTRMEIFNPRKKPMPLAGRVKRLDAETVAFQLGDTKVELQATESTFIRFQGSRNFWMNQFTQIDTKKRGYILKSQEKDNNGQPFLFYIFPLADRNQDGKLTRKEWTDYLDMQVAGSECSVALQLTDRGRSLFDLIDANGDGRLSIREFRTAWERVKHLAGGKKGLARADIPGHVQFSMSLGSTFFRTVAAPGKAKKLKGTVPAWFIKMDRNNDGDISPAEFLGTEEEFKKLDADGDGLISRAEAIAYEASRKKTGAKAP
jgi:Ca2+-binding EF-hand superfamily protein